jgi:hypothetical protein
MSPRSLCGLPIFPPQTTQKAGERQKGKETVVSSEEVWRWPSETVRYLCHGVFVVVVYFNSHFIVPFILYNLQIHQSTCSLRGGWSLTTAAPDGDGRCSCWMCWFLIRSYFIIYNRSINQPGHYGGGSSTTAAPDGDGRFILRRNFEDRDSTIPPKLDWVFPGSQVR